jgi:hypothetical protein
VLESFTLLGFHHSPEYRLNRAEDFFADYLADFLSQDPGAEFGAAAGSPNIYTNAVGVHFDYVFIT